MKNRYSLFFYLEIFSIVIEIRRLKNIESMSKKLTYFSAPSPSFLGNALVIPWGLFCWFLFFHHLFLWNIQRAKTFFYFKITSYHTKALLTIEFLWNSPVHPSYSKRQLKLQNNYSSRIFHFTSHLNPKLSFLPQSQYNESSESNEYLLRYFILPQRRLNYAENFYVPHLVRIQEFPSELSANR